VLHETLGYRLYGIDFLAQVGDEVKVQVVTRENSGPVHIDDVCLMMYI